MEFRHDELHELARLFSKKKEAEIKAGSAKIKAAATAVRAPSPLEPKRLFNCGLLLKKLMMGGDSDGGGDGGAHIIGALRCMNPVLLLPPAAEEKSSGGFFSKKKKKTSKKARAVSRVSFSSMGDADRATALEMVELLQQVAGLAFACLCLPSHLPI